MSLVCLARGVLNAYYSAVYYTQVIWLLYWKTTFSLFGVGYGHSSVHDYRNILWVALGGGVIFFAENDHPGGNSNVGGGFKKKQKTRKRSDFSDICSFSVQHQEQQPT